MRASNGAQASHSMRRDVVDLRVVDELVGRGADGGLLEHPQQIARGQHRAERGDHHVAPEQASFRRIAAGL